MIGSLLGESGVVWEDLGEHGRREMKCEALLTICFDSAVGTKLDVCHILRHVNRSDGMQ